MDFILRLFKRQNLQFYKFLKKMYLLVVCQPIVFKYIDLKCNRTFRVKLFKLYEIRFILFNSKNYVENANKFLISI